MNYNPSKVIANIHKNLKVEFINEIDSTNNEMKRRIINDPRDCPDVLVASFQTAGRGRSGKSFFSPMDSGIYLTLRISLHGINDIVYITSKAAVAVCKAIREISGTDALIKWVNDIYVEGRKICGILCERITAKSGGPAEIIIGVGVNMTASLFPDDIPNPGYLECDDFDGMLSAIVNNIYSYVYDCDNSSYLDEYRKMSCVLGKNIVFIQNGFSIDGIARSIDRSGYLTVSGSDGKEYTLKSGEISLRFQV